MATSVQGLIRFRRRQSFAFIRSHSLLALCALIVHGLFNTSQAQEDPTRFMFVKKWTGTFTRSFANSGTAPYGNCTAEWDYRHSAEIQAPLGLDTNTASHPHIRDWFSSTNSSERVELNERETVTCPGDPPVIFEWTARKTDPPPTGLGVFVNTQDKTYTVIWGASTFINAELFLRVGDMTLPPSLGDAAWFTISNAYPTLPLPANGLALSGSAKGRVRECQNCVVYYNIPLAQSSPAYLDTDLVFTWSIVPVEVEELEVVVEPEGYDEWIPEGKKDWDEVGNSLLIHARLQTKDGQTPVNKASKFTFKLLEVSHEPGVCMNWPTKNSADTKADLRFDEGLNQPLHWIDATTVETWLVPAGHTETEAMVSSYDFGSYAKLKVTAEVAGRPIVGYLKTDPSKAQTNILLPKRKANSLIADAWKKDNEAEDLDDDDDGDAIPPPGDTHKGDGLALYEEYRGFFENGEHLRTDPKTKDLFVLNKIQTHNALAGILNFAWQSGLKVHYELTTNEINTANRVINFNRSASAPNVAEQHGLILIRGPLDPGTDGQVVTVDTNNQVPGTPGTMEKIVITDRSNFDLGPPVTGRDLIDLTTTNSPTVSHELAHGCSVWHHGNLDKANVPWTVITNADGTRSVFENGTAITVMREDGSRLRFSKSYTNVWLGLDHGQHSGVDSCFMRYAAAWAYVSRTNSSVRYWVREEQGFDLCTSPVGTGVNDPNRSPPDFPQPRYFNADTNRDRGNCKGQICVNDKFIDAEEHKR